MTVTLTTEAERRYRRDRDLTPGLDADARQSREQRLTCERLARFQYPIVSGASPTRSRPGHGQIPSHLDFLFLFAFRLARPLRHIHYTSQHLPTTRDIFRWELGTV